MQMTLSSYSMEEYIHRLLTWKEGMERKGLIERVKDHNHDLCYRPWPTTGIRQLPMCNLSHWCMQQYGCMY